MSTRNHEKRRAVKVFLASVACCAVLLAAPTVANGDPLGAGDGTIYRLGPDSEYQYGCFDPCLCPIFSVQGMRGTMKLSYAGMPDGVHKYEVRDVNWTVPQPNADLRIIGAGTYEIGSPGPITLWQHRLRLALKLGDQPVRQFDSGWVPVEQQSGIHIAVSMNNLFCMDTVLIIHAEPVPAAEIQPYHLVAGATFQRGCWDPCDCLLGPERPMVGMFELVPIHGSALLSEFAVVNVDWKVLFDNTASASLPIQGFGLYQLLVDAAGTGQQRLMLDLIIDGEPRAHFDSGAVAESPWPHIDVTVSKNGLECFDTALHVVADPRGGNVCGGFAGLPCAAGEFCKYPIGTCNYADIFGVCTPIPTGGCPEHYDPVCGCDGATYPNECHSDAAQISLAHRGECGMACAPAPDGFSCLPAPCPASNVESCIGTVLHRDISNGAITYLECDCRDVNACHIEFGDASPFAVGYCPHGQACMVVATDTDNDGIDDTFSAECRPVAIGACCLDIDDGPVPFDTCVSTDEDTCLAQGGIFNPVNVACADVQACCLSFAGDEFCVDLNPFCCVVSGGIPQGPGSNCADVNNQGGCGQACGGIAGIPCEDADQFCMLPVGGCCCDFMGVCTTPSQACPAVWAPVCGCDGVTYGNACEAAAASMSIDHYGPCESTCPNEWDPVCGVNGVTYANACFAEQAGVPIAHPGECGAACGGLGPYPPCANGEFCKFPTGTCGDPTVLGECRPIPGGCPDVWEPVCGCDGNTYGNECDADAGGVSIAYLGECDATHCAATRSLAAPEPSYCPGVTKTIQIALTPPAGVAAVALEDVPPAGWVVGNISHEGSFDAVNGKVKWGPFFAPNIPGAVNYNVTPPNGSGGVVCFAGMISLDGANRVICGDDCIDRSCCPRIPADLPQPPCPGCPSGDCSSNVGGCADGRVTLRELIGYACAWMTGCNDDLAGMTRSAYIWRNGECYCWDEGVQNWTTTSCPAPDTGCCASSASGEPGPLGNATATVTSEKVAGGLRSTRDRSGDRLRQLLVSIRIEPPAGTSAAALEMSIPKGWTVTSASDGGAWDELHRKIKWGPFYDDDARSVTFGVRGPAVRLPAVINRVTAAVLPKGFSGTVSFDGVNHPIRTP